MISAREKYTTKLFLKMCAIHKVMESRLNFSLDLIATIHKVPDAALKELKEEYSLNSYIERITPLIIEQFSIEEMQEAIKFYSSGVGRKMIDPKFLLKIDEEGLKMDKEIAEKFALADEKF
jgi:hypothetical protein